MKINNFDIKGIIFDLDGTLYNKKRLKFYYTLHHFSKTLFAQTISSIRKKFMGKDFGSEQAFKDEFFKELANKTKSSIETVSEKYYTQFCQAFVNILEKRMKPRQNINALLDRLQLKGIKMAVLSDYCSVLERLEALEIDISYFNVIVSSESYGALKPCKRSFEDLAKKLDISNEKMLVVGDRDETDGESAKLAGMKYIKIVEKKPDPKNDIFLWNDFSKLIMET